MAANHIVVIANPDDRRFQYFKRAAIDAGMKVTLWDWQDVWRNQEPPCQNDVSWVRIESPGPNGSSQDIALLADWYAKFSDVTHTATSYFHSSQLLNDPTETAVMLDKVACHAHLQNANISVPDALAPVYSYEALRKALRENRWQRFFVKPRYGSSASGVLAVALSEQKVHATTTVSLEHKPIRLKNKIGLCRYTNHDDIETIVNYLAADGLHIERWFPKIGFDGATADLRMLTVAGHVTHGVLRSSQGPITNLQAGNKRGDLQRFRQHVGQRTWQKIVEECTKVAACFSGCLHLGIDVMVSAAGAVAVAEVNAFGDLLPNTAFCGDPTLFPSSRATKSTYASEIEALQSGLWQAWTK